MRDEFPTNQELIESSFSGKDFSGITVRDRDFMLCSFRSCQMAEIDLRSCRFQDCSFEQCDVSLAKLERCQFQNTTFCKSRLVGIDWTRLTWQKKALKPALHFVECNLNYSNFFGCLLKNTKFTDCMLQEVEFGEADLSQADLRRADLSQARFFHTDLTETDLRDARNYDINAVVNTLHKTRFTLPEAVSLLHSLDIILDEEY